MSPHLEIMGYQDPEDVETVELPPGGDELIGRPTRALVLAADSMMRKTVVRTLTRRGVDVAEAADEDSAWTILERWLPDVVVIDLPDPDLRGISFFSCLRADPRWRQIAVVALVSALDQRDVARLQRSADMLLAKPFRPRMFYTAVESIVVLPPRGAVFATEIDAAEVA